MIHFISYETISGLWRNKFCGSSEYSFVLGFTGLKAASDVSFRQPQPLGCGTQLMAYVNHLSPPKIIAKWPSKNKKFCQRKK